MECPPTHWDAKIRANVKKREYSSDVLVDDTSADGHPALFATWDASVRSSCKNRCS